PGDAGTGNRRQYGHLQRYQRGADQTVALSAIPRLGGNQTSGAWDPIYRRISELLAHHVFHIWGGEPDLSGLWTLVERRRDDHRRRRSRSAPRDSRHGRLITGSGCATGSGTLVFQG